jgi:hypothetical protein
MRITITLLIFISRVQYLKLLKSITESRGKGDGLTKFQYFCHRKINDLWLI